MQSLAKCFDKLRRTEEILERNKALKVARKISCACLVKCLGRNDELCGLKLNLNIHSDNYSTMITTLTKDKILSYLCREAIPEQGASGNTNDILIELEIDFDTFNAVMVQFQRFGFIEDLNLRLSYIHFVLRTDAHDFYQKGGFAIQEEIFKANLEKLAFEIENLKKQLSPDKLDTLNKISSIASALFGGLALLPK